jgi:hypothetical protein
MTLTNTLVALSLSSKLISIGQLTKELNCVILIFLDYYISISKSRRFWAMVLEGRIVLPRHYKDRRVLVKCRFYEFFERKKLVVA